MISKTEYITSSNKRIFDKENLVGNVAKLAAGNIIAQAISLGAVPFITRIFPPANYGVFHLFLSIVLLFSMFSSMSYVTAILLPDEDIEAIHLMILSISVVFGTSFFTLIVVILFREWIAHSLNASQMASFLWLLPITIFLDGLYLSFNYWTLRRKRFVWLSASRIAASISDRGTALLSGLLGHVSALVLIVSRILGIMSSVGVLLSSMHSKELRIIFSKVKAGRILTCAKRYKKFPLVGNWSVLIYNLSSRVPLILLAIFFPPRIVGFYALCSSVLGMPMGLIGDAIFKAFFQKITEMKEDHENLRKLSLQLLHYLILVSFFPMFLICVIGKELFCLVFGATWDMAGVYAQLMSIVFFLVFISRPIDSFFNLYERQEIRLYFDLLLLGFRIISLIIGGLIGNPLIAIGLYSLTTGVILLIVNFWIFNFIGVRCREVFFTFVRSCILALPFLIAIIVIKFFCFDTPLLLAGISILFVLLYYFIICVKKGIILGLMRHEEGG